LNPEEEKKEQSAPENAGEQKPAPAKRNSVLRYIAILFAAAFFLLLLSYLMQQRQMAETVSELKGSVSAMETIENMRKTNEELRASSESLESENRDLEDQLDHATDEKSQLSTALDASRSESDALSLLWQLSKAYSAKKYTLCREILEDLAPLSQYLPTEAEFWSVSPAAEYAKILKALD